MIDSVLQWGGTFSGQMGEVSHLERCVRIVISLIIVYYIYVLHSIYNTLCSIACMCIVAYLKRHQYFPYLLTKYKSISFLLSFV
jgi:hypothetical protein